MTKIISQHHEWLMALPWCGIGWQTCCYLRQLQFFSPVEWWNFFHQGSHFLELLVLFHGNEARTRRIKPYPQTSKEFQLLMFIDPPPCFYNNLGHPTSFLRSCWLSDPSLRPRHFRWPPSADQYSRAAGLQFEPPAQKQRFSTAERQLDRGDGPYWICGPTLCSLVMTHKRS